MKQLKIIAIAAAIASLLLIPGAASNPSNDAAGFSIDGNADDVWMERASLGVIYGF